MFALVRDSLDIREQRTNRRKSVDNNYRDSTHDIPKRRLLYMIPNTWTQLVADYCRSVEGVPSETPWFLHKDDFSRRLSTIQFITRAYFIKEVPRKDRLGNSS